MSDNKIRRVENGAFQKQASTLVTLDISNNELVYFEALTPMSSLTTLNLVNNKLAAIASGAFDNAMSLGSSKL